MTSVPGIPINSNIRRKRFKGLFLALVAGVIFSVTGWTQTRPSATQEGSCAGVLVKSATGLKILEGPSKFPCYIADDALGAVGSVCIIGKNCFVHGLLEHCSDGRCSLIRSVSSVALQSRDPAIGSFSSVKSGNVRAQDIDPGTQMAGMKAPCKVSRARFGAATRFVPFRCAGPGLYLHFPRNGRTAFMFNAVDVNKRMVIVVFSGGIDDQPTLNYYKLAIDQVRLTYSPASTPIQSFDAKGKCELWVNDSATKLDGLVCTANTTEGQRFEFSLGGGEIVRY